MVKGMDEIAKGKLIFKQVTDENGKTSWKVELVPATTKVDKNLTWKIPVSYLTGDLEFLAMILGREGYASWWCMFCMRYKPEWQQKPEDIIQGLDIDELIAQHTSNVTQQHTSTNMKGVKEVPYLKKGTIVIFPCLHGMLGVGNAIMDFFYDEIDRFVEPITGAELAVRQSIPNNNVLLEEEVHSLTLWNNSVTGGKEIKRLTRKVKEECESVEQPMTLAKHTIVTDMKSRIEALTQVGEKMSNNITKLKEEISTAKKKLDAFRKLRKVTHSSVYNGIERILKEHKIVRASYHGGISMALTSLP
uniref:Uncharacterized protein n=1 Tax=Skeletonema marinoi TaxID=267567 RepID=A0A7S2KVQ7_9STRA|mmetsp:Transcript_16831/g.28488  ORF Transcript_16831/g.28488 Transcript_16831/m.28488 type:complete len:304 (+) Transcript_16831:265-1176(+)